MKDRDTTIEHLQHLNESAKTATDALNKTLVEAKSKFLKDQSNVIREYEREVKLWKKQLSKTRKKHLKLQTKLDALENDTTQIDYEEVHHDNSITDHTSTINQDICGNPTEFILICEICAEEITDYAREYYCGEAINPV